jgi:hypothetical protein
VKEFSNVRDQTLDVMEILSKQISSKAIARYAERIEKELTPYKRVDFINSRIKNTPKMTRDSEEIAKSPSGKFGFMRRRLQQAA